MEAFSACQKSPGFMVMWNSVSSYSLTPREHMEKRIVTCYCSPREESKKYHSSWDQFRPPPCLGKTASVGHYVCRAEMPRFLLEDMLSKQLCAASPSRAPLGCPLCTALQEQGKGATLLRDGTCVELAFFLFLVGPEVGTCPFKGKDPLSFNRVPWMI